MRLTATDRNNVRTLAIVVACSTVGGWIFGLAVGENDGELRTALIGPYNGFLISLLIAGFEISSASYQGFGWLNRSPFLINVLLRSVIYLTVFTLVIRSSFVVMGVEAEGWRLSDHNFLITVGASFGASIVLNLMVRINQMLGRGVLAKFLTGYYYRPREEERIFMFIDLIGSTAIAERIGHLAFHRLLNDFIRDATEPILAAHGEIHNYVGDEIIVTWKPEHGLEQGRCVRCFHDIRRTLAARESIYRDRYGMTPKFRAALHMGPVVAGEMGAVKQSIVFLGDTVNTTARIEEACKELGAEFLASEAVVSRLAERDQYDGVDIGPMELRGKSEPIRLFRMA